MKIRLTSAEAFEKVLEALKRDPFYYENVNAPFLEYCVDEIKEGLADGTDEWYLEIEWGWNARVGKAAMSIRYFRGSDIPTDVEYLQENEEDESE